ncbi:uncharacterized protein PAC_19525 [Phialocephala subalpina]|uniref:Uncharacterized protein n=1 Tax=Phialocephala subalpina TaxID=576137 RepID=A0A1L7XXH8_9HELO|nr:uncharacterized protein PAC_19525 [Phialocephala subalpina]
MLEQYIFMPDVMDPDWDKYAALFDEGKFDIYEGRKVQIALVEAGEDPQGEKTIQKAMAKAKLDLEETSNKIKDNRFIIGNKLLGAVAIASIRWLLFVFNEKDKDCSEEIYPVETTNCINDDTLLVAITKLANDKLGTKIFNMKATIYLELTFHPKDPSVSRSAPKFKELFENYEERETEVMRSYESKEEAKKALDSSAEMAERVKDMKSSVKNRSFRNLRGDL